ncbi:MAG: ABC transporter permease [Bacillota bacterium]|nr:ABC transporter permease [Bacillota bacterium]
MLDKLRSLLKELGLPRTIIVSFLSILVILAGIYGIPLPALLSDLLVRVGMNGIFVLAMLPAIVSGIGPNFGLPLGILGGIVGALLAIEWNLTGLTAIIVAIVTGLPLAVLIGMAYGWLLNKVKGSEMMVSTYVGFSFVSLMNIAWILLPFKSAAMRWPIGRGLRVTIALEGRYDQVLNKILEFKIGGLTIPTGLLLVFLLLCLLVWLFMRSKTGIAMKAVGDSRQFAVASGLSVDKNRILGTVLSTALGAIGIVVFSQSYGFLQLYEAPMFMGFAAVASILIGGATVRKAGISNVIIGAILLQGLLVIALPVANKIITVGGVAEITRIIVSNGIILYALAQVGGGD